MQGILILLPSFPPSLPPSFLPSSPSSSLHLPKPHCILVLCSSCLNQRTCVCVCDPSTSSLPSIRHAIHSSRPIYQVVPFLPPTHGDPPNDEMYDDSSFRRFLPPRVVNHGYLERDCHAMFIPPWRTCVRDLRRSGNERTTKTREGTITRTENGRLCTSFET